MLGSTNGNHVRILPVIISIDRCLIKKRLCLLISRSCQPVKVFSGPVRFIAELDILIILFKKNMNCT